MARHTPRIGGFTLIEMLVTIVLMSILMALAFPSMSAWIRNSRIRAAGDTLQNALRLAQSEALRRSRQTVFSLTNSATPSTSLTAVANGRNWSINTVRMMTDDAANVAPFVESGVLATTSSDVQITGPAAICFNSLGRLVVNSDTKVTGGNCTTATATQYDITVSNANADTRPLRVLVALGGQVRMCDPAKALATYPDGCP